MTFGREGSYSSDENVGMHKYFPDIHYGETITSKTIFLQFLLLY